MADNIDINTASTATTIPVATFDEGGVQHEKVILEFLDSGAPQMVSAANPLPVSATINTTGLATSAKQDDQITQLVNILNKLIAAPSTAANQSAIIDLLTTIAAITQPLTDTQLRANPVPISGNVTATVDTSLLATQATLALIKAKTDNLDALLSSLNAEATQLLIKAKTDNLDIALSTRLKAADTLAGVTTVAAVTAITNALPAGTNLLGKTGIDQTTDGTTNKVRATATQKPSYGATVALAVTALQSMTSSTTVGWKSVRVSNLSALANDYEIFVSLTTANTAPSSSKSMQVYVIPWYSSDAGASTWFAASGGTATLPTSADATYTIASPHNFRLLGVLNYSTAQMVCQDTFLLSNCFGSRMPDGFSIFILNDSGAALSTGCIVDYTPINDTLV